MARYEVSIDESFVSGLGAVAARNKKSIPAVIADIVADWLEERQESGITEHFKRLVEDSISENEPVLRRFTTK